MYADHFPRVRVRNRRSDRRDSTAKARQRRDRKYAIHGTYDKRIPARLLMRDEAKMRNAVKAYRDQLDELEQLNEVR